MPSKTAVIQIGKRKIKLSNLGKVLFPEAQVIKAEVIQYYHQMAPVILRHIKRRPLTFIRYPDGVEGESFFQKNKPDWTPEWIESIRMGKGEKRINYIMATKEADLVFLANLACLEIHQSSYRDPDRDTPDHFVFDLDPPEDMPFGEIVGIAFSLRDHLRKLGYHPFVKTSGKKGIHVFVPIHRKWTYDTLKKTLKGISEGFVSRHPGHTTTNIRKEARKGKLFIDILRNSQSQTVVSPYSLRATPRATVSMPLTWEELQDIDGPEAFTIANVYDKVQSDGDAWEGFGSFAVDLHDKVRKKAANTANDSLRQYVDKRDFANTPEPVPSATDDTGNAFVIHRHDARRLHYDLRLSENGVLRSWAVPKGLPGAPGIKHLAVETEPHPMEYLDWEGTIPKGQYGAGDMWVFARGNYHITKEKKNGFYFRLESATIDNEFRMHRMEKKDWLLERVDPGEFDVQQTTVSHMLASTDKLVPDGSGFVFEVKWDGIRAMIYLDEDTMLIRSRSQRDITRQFPEFPAERKKLRCTQAILDGEIVVLNDKGFPRFKETVGRMHKTGSHSIQMASRNTPAYCYLFDVIYLDGCYVDKEPLWKRKEWLQSLIKPGGRFRFSESVEDGNALFEASGQIGLEGIMAKQKNSIYTIGKRSTFWVKVKHRNTMTCRIIGYTEGQGDRAPYFGALHLADAEAGNHVYLGKVGTGFDVKTMRTLSKRLKALEVVEKPIEEKLEDDKQSTWIDPVLYCEVTYASITPNGTLREPVFVGLRPDMAE